MEIAEMSLGNQIRIMRKIKNLTQHELADKVHKGVEQIRKYEKDQSLPPITTLKLMAEIFGTTLDSLVYEDRDNNWENIVKTLSSLDKEEQETVKRMIKGLKLVHDFEKE